ncbi:hypothetical protein ABEV54_04480 [Peribacillus psychrosaccharolyticus]
MLFIDYYFIRALIYGYPKLYEVLAASLLSLALGLLLVDAAWRKVIAKKP